MSTSTTNVPAAQAERSAPGRAARALHPGAALAVLATAQLMVVLDGTIVTVALPTMQKALGFSAANLSWVVTAYTLAFGSLLLLGGRLGDVLGRRKIFAVGLGIFTVASLLGGFATGQSTLIAARVVQGVGGALAAATTLALVTTIFAEGKERNRALGIYSAMSGAGASIGLLLGGLLTEWASWRWVMFVNVPVGIAVLLLALRILPESDRLKAKFDVPGTLTVSAGLGLGVYGLTHAASHSWTDALTIGTLIASVVLLAAFVLIESRSSHALMPLWIFARRSRAGAFAAQLLLTAALLGAFFFLTQLMQDVLGYGPMKTGAAFLPTSVGIIVVSVLGSRIVSIVGPRVMATTGTAVAAVALLWFAQADENTTYLTGLLPGMLLLAIGLGLSFIPVMMSGTAGVPAHQAGLASGMLNTMQQVGSSIGIAVLATVSATAARGNLGDWVLGHPGSPVSPQVQAHAATIGYTQGFTVAAGIALLASLTSLMTLKVNRTELAEALPVGAAA